MTSGDRQGRSADREIEWREWTHEAFEEAEKDGKLILLDLTATWCHWCHVMDRTTYSDRDVARTINREFVPVRVDIDRRPDISERYNRGGFPTTAFLSHRGESIWGATYIPAPDMKRIMETILNAKRSGEIDHALERASKQPIDAMDRSSPMRTPPSKDEVDDIFDEVFDTYDVEHGGFGLEPKFPHPEAVDLLIARHAALGDPGLAEAVEHTLLAMAEGLYDRVEGGVFRYSVSKDWSVPHYEKMLETNLGYLRNLARAHAVLGQDKFKELAEGVSAYLLRTLRDPVTGAFFGSQDADEGYYMLGAPARSRRAPPSVDKAVYSGWNALASAVLVEAGALMGRQDLTDAGLAALDNLMRNHWDDEKGLVRHSEGQDLYLSEDQVELLGALIAAMGLRGTGDLGPVAARLADSARTRFAHADGGLGDVSPGGPGIDALAKPLRSLVTNAKWAQRLSALGIILDRLDLVQEAGSVLRSFDAGNVRAHGVFAAPYLMAAEAISAGPLKVEVHVSGGRPEASDLWTAAMRALESRAVILPVMDGGDFAVVCSANGCSPKIGKPDELVRALRSLRTSQA